jgi:hypothetical protein
MSQEIQVHSYYEELKKENWISTNLCCSIGMEFWISWLLFKRDLSRVLYSKEDICFRRRVETLGRGDVKSNDLNYLTLDLPYAVYSQTGSFEEDDRIASMNAAAAVKGHLQPDTGIILRNMPVKVKFSMTAFYSRREDVDVASQLLYWEQKPTYPIYFIVHHQIAGQPLDIPVFMSIDSVDANTDYQEKSWLTSSKIFPIKVEVTVRTYQTLIESVDEGRTLLPLRWSGLYGYNRDHKLYLTQNTILMWADDKFSHDSLEAALKRDPTYLERSCEELERYLELDESNGETLAELANHGKLYDVETNDGFSEELILVEGDIDDLKARAESGEKVESELESRQRDRMELLKQRAEIDEVNGIVESAVKGYFSPSEDLDLIDYRVKEATDTTLTVEWGIKEDQVEKFYDLVIYVPGVVHERIHEAFQREFVIRDLHPGSTYPITLILKSADGEKTYLLNGTTTGEKALESDLLHNLVGRVFTRRA